MKNRSRTIFWIAILEAVAIIVILSVLLYTKANSKKSLEIPVNDSLDYLTIVNEKNPYDFNSDYNQVLQQNLVYLPDVYGNAIAVESATAAAYYALRDALQEQGFTIGLLDGHRTKDQQQEVYDYYADLEGWAENNKVALPGYSEHHTGLLLNVLIWYQGPDNETPIWYTETAERQADIAYFKLLHETLADYGFIDRYPLDKEDITGIPSEPYEIRFVGSPEIAHKIMDNNLALEEYILQK